MLRKLFLTTLLSAVVGVPMVALAKSDSDQSKKSDEVVAQALQAESKGDLSLRAKLLSQAGQLGESPSLKWHQGLIQGKKGKWFSVLDSFEIKNEKLSAYEETRKSATKTVDSQLSLAQWCVQQNLMPQARSHFNQVLQLDFNNAMARTALGYRYVNDQWISPAEIERLATSINQTNQAYQKYGEAIQAIAQGLESPSNRIRDKANQKLTSIKDPAAIPAMEAVFHSNPNLSASAIQWLSGIDAVESSHALARYALLSNDQAARELATAKLKERPLHDVVPKLLEMMTAPSTATLVPSYDRNGTLVGYSQYLVKEGFESTKIEATNTRLRTSGRFSQGQRFLESQMKSALDSETAVDSELPQIAAADQLREENGKITERNRKIGTLVAALGNTTYSGDAKDLWKWWDQYNETNYQGFKPDQYSSLEQDYSLFDSPPTGGDDQAGECFVKGTPVVTQRGMRAIETIEVGDQVLSRSTSSGELTWKPVLRATRRPLDKTRIISLGKEQIQCTSGHLLWVSGEGWKKVSQIKKGDILHGAKEPVVVDDIRDAKDEVTYNLDVGDFGTYFAGDHMILSHDVKPRSANRETVPGLKMVSTATTKSKK